MAAVSGSSGAAPPPAPPPPRNNRRPNLLPPAGAVWRGAELGREFLPAAAGSGPADSGGAKLARYRRQYPRAPLHVYRSFNLTVRLGRCREFCHSAAPPSPISIENTY